jgi:3-oxoadipate enol-lactonase
VNLHYEEHSNLAKQDILFLHGNLASTNWWQPTLKEWKKDAPAGTGSLLFADWRGCGRNTDWLDGAAFTLKELAEDFLHLLQRQQKDQISLVGHSLGGLIALQMMALDPRRISRAVLLDPVGARGVVFDDSMYDAFRQMAASRDLTRMVILSTIRGEENLPLDYKELLADDAFKAVKGIGTSVLEILKTVDLTEEAAQVKTPTLILHGQHDQIIPLKDSEELASMMPNAKLEILPDAGHCWNVENPAALVKRLRQWL